MMQVLILFILGLAFTGCDTLYDAPPWAPPVSGGSVTGLSATDAWHRAESVMGHVQHLSLESLVKMDHFQKEPPLNLKGDHWGTREPKGARAHHPKGTDRKFRSD